MDVAIENTQFARMWRNKQISHTDFKYALAKEVEPLEPSTLEKMHTAVQSIFNVLAFIHNVKFGGQLHNGVIYRPISNSFIYDYQQLISGALYIDTIIDPERIKEGINVQLATEFLRKLDLPPSHENVTKILDLQKSLESFRQ